MFNLVFVQDTLDKYGLSDRFDASEALLYLDSWRRLGPNQRGKPCGRGWVGLRGACKRGKKSDDNAAKIKESKIELADKIRAKKGLRDRNAPKIEQPIPSTRTKAKAVKTTPKVPQITDDQKRILGNDIDRFIRTGQGFMDTDRSDGRMSTRRESLKSAVANGKTENLKTLGKQIYYSSTGENKREFRTVKQYSEAFAAHAVDRFTPKSENL